MSIFLAFTLYPSFFLDNARALPLVDSGTRGNTTAFLDDSSSCNNSGNSRTIWDIIWSCLVLIFTCNWVAIHPNIPSPDESTLDIYLRRAGITLVALIAPELLIMWALRQWTVARKYQKQYSTSADLGFHVSLNISSDPCMRRRSRLDNGSRLLCPHGWFYALRW